MNAFFRFLLFLTKFNLVLLDLMCHGLFLASKQNSCMRPPLVENKIHNYPGKPRMLILKQNQLENTQYLPRV